MGDESSDMSHRHSIECMCIECMCIQRLASLAALNSSSTWRAGHADFGGEVERVLNMCDGESFLPGLDL